jgi:D-alanyl-D-alanine carboxypeptidase/D-alanyl-D-alanine-endopeptidase (penicillin-binding protein 4)
MPLRRVALALGLLVLCAFLSPAAAPALDRATLQAKLAKETARLGGASGALVVDLDTGEELYARRPDGLLVPASNEKLFTTSAALLSFTPDGTLPTEVRLGDGAAIDPDGRLDGDLYIVGSGDPTLGDDELVTLADELQGLGLDRVTGSVLGDESAFDQLRGGPDSSFKPDLDLGGWLSALAYRHGRAYPGGPAQVAAARLQALLKDRGVVFGRRARAGSLAAGSNDGGAGADAAQDPGGDGVLSAVQSPTMARLSATTNRPSDNFYAEMLLKALGSRYGDAGTTAAGVAAARAALAPLGVAPRMVDGSGLSRANRTTPRQLVALLRGMHERPEGQPFLRSLARPGQAGTLRKRMRGTAAASRCRAKTGTLVGVSALSGYCTSVDGHMLAFAFMENRVFVPAAKKIEDRMVPAIANYDAP